jgi:hypothetical protein
MNDDVQEFLSNLPNWTKFFDGFRLPPTVKEEQAIDELQQRLANIRRRLRDGPDAPLRLAFFGPTGAGKSKLFGSLIRDNFSGSGFKRPFTRCSFYYVHNDWKPLVAALEGEIFLHEETEWQDTILIDSPDFDSVELKNQAEAERVFLESDGFLFVTDALKYADASTWEYLNKIHAAGKIFAIILNKVNSDAVTDGFRERFQRTLAKDDAADYAEVIVPEFRIDDSTLIDPDHESMQSLRAVAKRLVTGDGSRRQASAALLTKECEAFCSYSDDLRTRIVSRRTQVVEAKQALQVRTDAAMRRLNLRLTSGLEPAVRDDVYQDVLRRLEKIDVLSYPRKLIAMPINGIRSLVTGWLTDGKKDVVKEEPAFADPISSETFHLLESELIAFADQSRNDIAARPGLETLIDRETFKQLRFDHSELQEMYVEHHERFTSWVASNAEETAAEITGENKAKFVLSQVLFNTVLISSQVAIGGFTFVDLGASGVISPWVAKGISMAIGSEKVKAFEEAAHAEHQRSLAELLERGRTRFEDFLDRSCVGLDELEQNLNEISDARSKIEKIVKYFQGEVRSSASTPGDAPTHTSTERED